MYKAKADADGRSIAGIKVKVSGPFDQFTLFNDGKHDDEGFSDNVVGGDNEIQAEQHQVYGMLIV